MLEKMEGKLGEHHAAKLRLVAVGWPNEETTAPFLISPAISGCPGDRLAVCLPVDRRQQQE